MALLVAGHAAFHGDWDFERNRIVCCDIAVAGPAIHSRFVVPGVAKKNKIFNCVNLAHGERRRVTRECRQSPDFLAVGFDCAVAVHALSDGGERSTLAGLDRCMAVAAFDLQPRVPFVAERHMLAIRRETR